MSRIVSIHEYVLAPGVSRDAFLRAVSAAERRGLFDLPGLIEHQFLKSLRGSRGAHVGALWVYESREAWEALWGPPGQPVPKDEFPECWKVWEDELLAPLLDRDPQSIDYAAYERLDGLEMVAVPHPTPPTDSVD